MKLKTILLASVAVIGLGTAKYYNWKTELFEKHAVVKSMNELVILTNDAAEEEIESSTDFSKIRALKDLQKGVAETAGVIESICQDKLSRAKECRDFAQKHAQTVEKVKKEIDSRYN